MITQGTTPTIKFSLVDDNEEPIDLSTFTIILTIEDKDDNKLDLTNDRMTFNEDLSVYCRLKQEETLKLSDGRLKIQLKAKDENGVVVASLIQYLSLYEILNKETI